MANNTIQENKLSHFQSTLNVSKMQLNSANDDEVLQGLLACRKYSSVHTMGFTPLQDLYEASLIPKLVEILRKTDSPKLQHEAAWTLSNIACSTNFVHVGAILDTDVFECVMPLLSSNNEELLDQTLWLVANLIGPLIEDAENEKKVTQSRKKLIEMGIIPTICQLGLTNEKRSVAANIAWALSNILYSAELVPQSQALSMVPVLAKLIRVPEPEAWSCGAEAIARLTEKHGETMIQRVLDTAGLTDYLLGLLESDNEATKNNTSKVFANMTAGTPEQIIEQLNRGLMHRLLASLNNATNPTTLIESIAKVLENVTLSVDETLLGIIINEGVFGIALMAPSITKLHSYIWALSNATFAANDLQLDYFIARDFHKQLAAALSATADKDLTVAILEGLENLLKRGPKVARSVPELKKWLQNQTSNDPEIQALVTRLDALGL